MSKNLILEELQKHYHNPTKGIHYLEEVNRIGGSDHQPDFEAKIQVPSFNGCKPIEVIQVGFNQTKKALLRDAWSNVWREFRKNEIEDEEAAFVEKQKELIFGEEDE